jgi:hypothetical protein
VVDNPADFDLAFRRAAARRPAATASIEVNAYCGLHPEAKMLPAPEAAQPEAVGPGEQRVTVTCPEGCGTTVQLSIRQGATAAEES